MLSLFGPFRYTALSSKNQSANVAPNLSTGARYRYSVSKFEKLEPAYRDRTESKVSANEQLHRKKLDSTGDLQVVDTSQKIELSMSHIVARCTTETLQMRS